MLLVSVEIYNCMRIRYVVKNIVNKFTLDGINFFKRTIIHVFCISAINNREIFVLAISHTGDIIPCREGNPIYRGEGAVFAAFLTLTA